jgi:hypothetical protein
MEELDIPGAALVIVDAALMRSHVVQPGDQVVLVCGFLVGTQRSTNMAFLHTVGEQ